MATNGPHRNDLIPRYGTGRVAVTVAQGDSGVGAEACRLKSILLMNVRALLKKAVVKLLAQVNIASLTPHAGSVDAVVAVWCFEYLGRGRRSTGDPSH